MYTEEPKKEINWGSLIKKGLIIVIFVILMFIIFWLLIKGNESKNNVNVNTNNNNSQNQNSSLHESFYSKDFIENYRYFHDTAKEYFLISELPAKGKTIKYTLQELINKGLILPFGYNNQSCDLEASYVLVSNIDGQYKMTVTLVCGTEVGKTTEDLGCNQLCNNGTCETVPDTPSENKPSTDKQYVTEYEYKQPYIESVVNYTCPSGYTLDGNLCYKNNSTTVKATKVVTYTCENGYDKVGTGENTKCVKNGSKTTDAKKVTDYVCEEGYEKTGTGSSTTCVKRTNSQIPADYKEIYVCEQGYTQIGYGINSTCVKNTYSSYKAVTQVYDPGCPSGFVAIGNTCVKYANYISACKDGYSLVGNNCVKNSTSTPITTCSGDYHLENGTCVANSATSSALKETFQCSSGKLENSQCKITRTRTEIVNSQTAYIGDVGCSYLGYTPQKCTSGKCTNAYYQFSCPAGSYHYTSATVSYKCESGYKQVGSGVNAKCYRIDSSKLTKKCSTGNLNSSKTACVVENIDNSKFDPYCPAGFTKSGSGYNTICKQTEDYMIEIDEKCIYGGTYNNGYCETTTSDVKSPIKQIDFYCSKTGYQLSGSTCSSILEAYKAPTLKTTYSCSEGQLNGDKCVLNTNDVKKPTVTTTYKCENGYNKHGQDANTTCTKGMIEIIDATKTSKNVTKYRYQWSEKTSIEGWTKTGKTRKVEASVK